MTTIASDHLTEAGGAIKEASMSAGRFAGYLGITAVSVVFAVLVLVMVAQSAVIWVHRVTIPETHRVSLGIVESEGLAPPATRLHGDLADAAKSLPAYGAGLKIQ